MLWVLVHQIFEQATNYAYPVVEHRFVGKTKAEAQGYHDAHLGTDSFLRGCEQRGRWQDVTCRVELSWWWMDPRTGQMQQLR
jgi:hypothetical protein